MRSDLGDFPVLCSNVWDNYAGNYENIPDQTGLNGNISKDPTFKGDGSFHLVPGSPCTDSGDTVIIDIDGTRSDMGIYGGPSAVIDRGR